MKKGTETEQDYLSLDVLCQKLSISINTGKNWIRLKKIKPQRWEMGKPLFSHTYVTTVEQQLTSGKLEHLKSRRNKKYISGNTLYASYLRAVSANLPIVEQMLSLISSDKKDLSELEIRSILCECALKLFQQVLTPEQAPTKVALLPLFINNTYKVAPFNRLISDLLPDKKQALSFWKQCPELFTLPFSYTPQEDLLGLLYLSLKNIGERKSTGAYYTPTDVVDKLLSRLHSFLPDLSKKKILDPCCGTGNFLLHLPNQTDLSLIHGNDIDEISVLLTRINLALLHKPTDLDILYRNITQSDFLLCDSQELYDCIIGNPPWGYAFSSVEKENLKKHYQCIQGKQIESYDLFVERSLSKIKNDGIVSFVLPEAILHTKAHTAIRTLLLKTTSITYLEYLGNVFHQVLCPSIILELKRTDKPLSTVGTKIANKQGQFTIQKERDITSQQFDLFIPDVTYSILDKLLHCPHTTTLYQQADFALGIVTGDNNKFLQKKKTKKNEIILKGTNIEKYNILPGKNYIIFSPRDYQQVANSNYYRAEEKLLYRFISKRLTFTYDNKQTLSLNSCNLVIPKIPELPIKYVLAILNSSIAQFIFTNLFHSVKVLRSHIEQIPIPMPDTETIKKCVGYVEQLLSLKNRDEETYQNIYLELDKLIADLFHLTDEEYSMILKEHLVF
ncbi:putative uncharacterized protein [Clostridium sp. CAG:411]|mgnify:CR=1 FL=1|nr:TaqI-like C-terminal specificity domain-containing protein [Lachnospiraceae bacterium]CDE47715.1 putative uncharacterized protein [Clostridium sp. CAG:411]